MGNSSRAGYSILPESTCSSRPPGARASGLITPFSSTVDSILAERNSSKTLSSTPPLRIVDWMIPEPSLTIRKMMPPLERLFCNHPLTRTCFPPASTNESTTDHPDDQRSPSRRHILRRPRHEDNPLTRDQVRRQRTSPTILPSRKGPRTITRERRGSDQEAGAHPRRGSRLRDRQRRNRSETDPCQELWRRTQTKRAGERHPMDVQKNVRKDHRNPIITLSRHETRNDSEARSEPYQHSQLHKYAADTPARPTRI